MFTTNGNDIQMTEGDFGIELPITISGVTLGASDSLKFTISQADTEIIIKEFTNITDNTVALVLTATESALLPVGEYLYSLDWYQNGVFMCNIVPFGSFKVGDKA